MPHRTTMPYRTTMPHRKNTVKKMGFFFQSLRSYKVSAFLNRIL